MSVEKGDFRESELAEKYYFSDVYFTQAQLFSLSEQINLLYTYADEFQDVDILEVGKGNGFVSDFFKKAGYSFTTFDINKSLKPDIVGNILKLNKCLNKKFDIVHCSEVLEHIPFASFEQSLQELHTASKKYVIITVPEFKRFFGVNLQIRFPKIVPFSIPLFIGIKYKKALSTGHFWELEYSQETSRSNIESIINKNFHVVKKGRFPTNPYHNFYVLKVR